MLQAIRAAFAIKPARLSRVSLFRFDTARRFARHDDGAAAVEFGIVAAPFLALMFAIMETALVFFAGQTLETAVADSARLIMTGQAQSQSFSATQFKSAVCAKIGGLFDCAAGLYVDVKTYSSFGAIDNSSPVDAQGHLTTSNFGYTPGGPGDIEKVTIDYSAPSKRDRKIMGGLVPYGQVWRTGANAATTLTTEADLMIGSIHVPKGTYTIYTIPGEKEWTLIVNKQTGQWGTEYDASKDLGRTAMTISPVKDTVETFNIGIDKNLTLTWENTRAWVPIMVH